MLRYVGLVFLSLLSWEGSAQYHDADGMMYNIDCYDGSIMLKDGTELKGLVCYDSRREALVYKNEQVSRSLQPTEVIAFEYFDETIQKQRVFFSLGRLDSKTNLKRMFFFEVLKDFKDFAVVLRKSPVAVDNRMGLAGAAQTNQAGTSTPHVTKTVITQIEVVYFMSAAGEIEPYVKLIHKIIDGSMLDRDKMKTKVVDKNIFEKYFTSVEIKAMEIFADDNKLDFEVKEDLIKILDFCYDYREAK